MSQKLNIQIVSDLHVEFLQDRSSWNLIKPKAKILALLGDICCAGSDIDYKTYIAFMNEITPKFEMILLIPGNHEFYREPSTAPNEYNTMSACMDRIKAMCKKHKKIKLLNRGRIKINTSSGKYLIAGATLWSRIPDRMHKQMPGLMSDYSTISVKQPDGKITNITPVDVNKLHKKDATYFVRQLAEAKAENRKAIFLSHHKPYISELGCGERSHAYQSDMSRLFKSPLVAWCYGHTHIRDTVVKNNVRIYSNPKGYPHQRTKYDKEFVISV